jgi:N-acetylmuramoyl-L-alanine amidase
MGFLSNAEEEKWLASEAGKSGIVKSIFTAFETYYNENKN